MGRNWLLFGNSRNSKKCLVINSTTEQGPSFLNVGPIQTINEASAYRPTFHVDFAHEAINFDVAAQRIRQFSKPNRRRFKVAEFERLDGHHQFAVVHFAVSIFPSLDIDSLAIIMRRLFVRYRKSRIEQMVSLLVSVGYFGRIQDDPSQFYAMPGVAPLMEIEGASREDLLAESLSIFQKIAPDLIPNLEQQHAA